MSARLSSTTRMPNGVTNAAPRQTMGNASYPDPTWSIMFALDFVKNSDTNINTGGGGSFALTPGVGGLAALTSGAVAGTLEYAATPQPIFQITNGQRMFFKWSGSLDSLLGTAVIGFVEANTATPNGVYITSTVTTGALQLVIKNGTGTTTVPFPSNLALVAGTTVELGIEIDPQGNVFAYYNPTTGASKNNTDGSVSNGPVAAAYAQLNGVNQNLTLPTGVMDAQIGVIPTTNVARVLTSDFLVASQNRGTEQV